MMVHMYNISAYMTWNVNENSQCIENMKCIGTNKIFIIVNGIWKVLILIDFTSLTKSVYF